MFNNELWNKPAGGGGGTTIYDYQIANSVRFDGSTSVLNKTWGSAATNDNKMAISVWVKGTKTKTWGVLASAAQNDLMTLYVGDRNDATLRTSIGYYAGNGGNNATSKAYDRDPSAWRHIVWIYDSTLGTGTDRIKIYNNGELWPTANTTYWQNIDGGGYPGQNVNSGWGKNGNDNHIGDYQYNNAGRYNGYIADYVTIDGAATISDFGEIVNGVWVPKDPSGLTFGNNGFWLKFTNSGDFGEDFSGNNNDWSVTGLATHDIMLDSPTFSADDGNGGNFATLNPEQKFSIGTFSEGNLKYVMSGGDNFSTTQALTTKSYCEVRIDALGNYGGALGFGSGEGINGYYDGVTFQTNYLSGALYIYQGSSDISSGNIGGVVGAGSVVMMAYDPATYKWWVGVDGTWRSSGNPATGANPIYTGSATQFENTGDVFWKGWKGGANSMTVTFNFGQDGTFGGQETAGGNADDTGYGNFLYDVPAGFLANCTGNVLVADAIDPAQTNADYPQKLFNPVLYTGSGGTQTITGVGFQPDFTWIKNRGASADHVLMDSTRGAYGTNDYYYLRSNTTAAQDHTTDFHNFASDGFIVSGTGSYFNASGNTFVGWNWRANGGTTASNSNGDLTSTVQVDPSGGFSIVTYTGTLSGAGTETVGHGLSVAPNFIITKVTGQVGNWWVWSDEFTSWNYGMNLNTTSALFDKSGNGSMSAPTSTVFDTNWTDGMNDEQGNIAYCFANIEGYTRSGSYVGNGDDDGTFVYTGFRPAFIIIKEKIIDSWLMYDDKRFGINTSASGGNSTLYPDDAASEGVGGGGRAIDILSNGFKLRTSNATGNANGGNYLYFAMAENPFKYSTAR